MARSIKLIANLHATALSGGVRDPAAQAAQGFTRQQCCPRTSQSAKASIVLVDVGLKSSTKSGAGFAAPLLYVASCDRCMRLKLHALWPSLTCKAPPFVDVTTQPTVYLKSTHVSPTTTVHPVFAVKIDCAPALASSRYRTSH